MNLHGEGVFVFNVLSDAVCVLSAGRFLGIPMTWKRVLLAALLGGVYAILSLYAALFAGLAGLLVSSVMMSAAAYPRQDTVRGAGGIWLVGLGGYGMSHLLSRVCAHETVAVLLGLVFMLSFCLMGRKPARAVRGVLRIRAGNQSCVLPALVDTGNTLKMPGPGIWVIVAPAGMSRVLELDLETLDQIPICTASGNGFLPVFVPDRCLWYPKPGKGIALNAAVALAETELPYALVPCGALQREWKEEKTCRNTEREAVSGPGCW